MDPSKALNSGHKFFCKESAQTFKDTSLTDGVRSWKEMTQVLMDNRKVIVRAFLKGNEEEYDNWVKRAHDCMGVFELVMLGGDLKPTEDYRVEDGSNMFYGSKEECLGYISGNGLKIEEDKVINEEGRVFNSVEQARKDSILEVRYYDEIDDIEFWQEA